MKLPAARITLEDELDVQTVRLPPLRAEPADTCAKCDYPLDEGACTFCAGATTEEAL